MFKKKKLLKIFSSVDRSKKKELVAHMKDLCTEEEKNIFEQRFNGSSKSLKNSFLILAKIFSKDDRLFKVFEYISKLICN